MVTLKAALDTKELKSGLSEVRSDLTQTAATAATAGAEVASIWQQQDMVDQLVGAIHQVVQQLEDFREESAETHKALLDASRATDELGDEARDTANDLDRLGRGGKDAGSKVALAMTGAQAAFELAKDAVDGLANIINAMAEDGNAGAIELQNAFSEWQEMLFEIGEDPRVVVMLEDMAEILRELIPLIKTGAEVMLDFTQSARDGIADWVTWGMEQVGILEEGTYDLLQADQERFDATVKAHDGSARAARKELDAKKKIFDLDKEMKSLEKANAAEAEKSSLDQVRSLEEILDVIEDTTEALKDQNKTAEEQKKLFDRLAEAEKKAEDFRKNADQVDKTRREEHRAWIAEKERLEVESRQRILQAEVEMLQGINRAREEADKKHDSAFSGPAGSLIAGAAAAKNDQRKVYQDFIKNRVAEAEKSAAAAADQAQARAEEEARKSGADPEGVKEYGREARRKAEREGRGAVNRARGEAAKDWRDYQNGKGTEEERAATGREIDASRERVGNDYLEQKRKELEREARRSGGRMTAEEKALIDNIMRIVQETMHSAAIQGGDLASLQEQVKALNKMLEALTNQGNERRRRNGGRP